MRINAMLDKHDRAALVALLLEDGRRVRVIIDDGTATTAQPGYESLLDSQMSDVIDGNSEVLLYVPDRDKEIRYLDDNYEKQPLQVSGIVLYKFTLMDGKVTVKAYGGTALRDLMLSGM